MAIVALTEVDREATDADRMAVRDLLDGRAAGVSRVVPFDEAAKILGVSKMTIFRLVKRNRLKGVDGVSGKQMGVTESSLRAFS